MVYPPYPDSIVCGLDSIPQVIVYELSSQYDDGVDQITIYSSVIDSGTPPEILGYGNAGVYSSGASGTDCENVDLFDISTTSQSVTPYGYNYGDTIVVQPAGLSTDPMVAVLLTAFLVIYTAQYVRRVFFA